MAGGMKVLLTGASGFVGSHILDHLDSRGWSSVVLLRKTSDRTFVQHHLPKVEVRFGSISDPASLAEAMEDVTHVIHCAGSTRAVRSADFYRINQLGTRNVVAAANAASGRVRRLIHISSLAVTGPATREAPANEDSPLRPISEYGRSKAAGETEVRNNCRVEYVILRPPAVYGPRDNGFFSMFQAVQHHVLPRPSAKQALSLVYVKDLAAAVVAALEHPQAGGRTYFVSGREVVTAREMAAEIAAQMGRWTVPCPLPALLLLPVCLSQELLARATGTARLLNLQKFAELRARGWVCDPARMERELGFRCATPMRAGIAETLAWYQDHQWL